MTLLDLLRAIENGDVRLNNEIRVSLVGDTQTEQEIRRIERLKDEDGKWFYEIQVRNT